ncbi:MAG: hypothetical protein JXA20_01745 [Spirochaetes bacterium]|nr:hypothetical protein [Spirochaetota bacterium]
MRTVLELFSRRVVVLLALVVFCGPVMYFDLDKRIGILFMGIIFFLAGAGQWVTISKESTKGVRGAGKVIAVFLMVFGFFMVAADIALVATGRMLH